jgi:hypothetical protein
MALKETQGLFNVSGFPRTIPQYGCIVMEVEDWIDGIVSISSYLFVDITSLLQEDIANVIVESTGVGS